MSRNWNFYAGIRKISLEKFINSCKTVDDIKIKLDTLNILYSSFPLTEAQSLLANRNAVEQVAQPIIQVDEIKVEKAIVNSDITMPRRKTKHQKVEINTTKDE